MTHGTSTLNALLKGGGFLPIVFVFFLAACTGSESQNAPEPESATVPTTVGTVVPATTANTAPTTPLTTPATILGSVVGVELSITLGGNGCASSIPNRQSAGAIPIKIFNKTAMTIAVVIGTYTEGFGRDDLISYGADVSTRPDFIEALEIYQVGSGSTRQVSFDHGPGRYFVVCMPDTNTMVVLDDVTIKS